MEKKPNRRTLDEQIALAQKELAQKEARVKELLGRQRSKEDKARTNRLCRRGGLVEKLLPNLAIITDKQFDAFLEKTLLTGDAEKILAAMLPAPPAEPQGGTVKTDGEAVSKAKPVTDEPKGGEPTADKQAVTAAQGDKATPAPKPTVPTHSGCNSVGGSGKPSATPANQHNNNGANGNGNGGDGARHGG